MKKYSGFLPSSPFRRAYKSSTVMVVSALVAGQLCFSQVAAPQIVPSGNVSGPVSYQVAVTCATSGVTMRYSLDNTDPDPSDPLVPIDGFITVPRTVTLKVKAWLGAAESAVASGNYYVVGDIAAGSSHAVAIKTNKQGLGWGLQRYGALANGVGTNDPLVAPPHALAKLNGVDLLDSATGCAAGLTHSLMVFSDSVTAGGVWSYGLNDKGQLGNNTTTTPTTYYAVRVLKSSSLTDYLTGVTQVSAADKYSAARMADGRVMTWGENVSSRLGRTISPATANRYAGYVTTNGTTQLTGIQQIATGEKHMIARTAHSFESSGGTGSVYIWGLNSSGQLGNGTVTAVPFATLNTTLTNILDVSASVEHTAVVKWDASNLGTVYCFGAQKYGRLGNNASNADEISIPQQVRKADLTPLTNIIEVACGPRHTLALDSNRRVWAWGYNGDGELGINSTTQSQIAVPVLNPAGTGPLENIVRISAGGVEGDGFSLAIADNGKVYSWGAKASNQLGYVSSVAKKLPTEVPSLTLTNIGAPVLTTVTAILQSPAEPGRCDLTPTVTDPDGSNDLSHIIYNVNGVEQIAFNNGPSSNLVAVFSGLSAGSYNFTATAYDKSGIASSPFNGTFMIKPSVSIALMKSYAQEGASALVYRVSRASSNSSSLQVSLSVSGSASPGVDYATLPAVVSIPAGATYIDLAIDVLTDTLLEAPESVKVTVASNPNYSVSSLSSAELEIYDAFVFLDDYDGDGLSGQDELQAGTNPMKIDSDGDGIPDNIDDDPLVIQTNTFLVGNPLFVTPVQ